MIYFSKAGKYGLHIPMTNENLVALINRANGQAGEQVLFIRPLTDSVHWAKAWHTTPVLNDTTAYVHGYSVYLIRNPELQYVGIVLDMGESDLHWLVLPEHRGNGYLSTALREVILPHLLQERETQRITISRNFGPEALEASERVARAAGFVPEPVAEEEEESQVAMRYTPADVGALPTFTGQTQLLSDARLQQLRYHFAYHANSLRLLAAEIDMQLGDTEFTEHINDLANQVHSLGLETEDTNWEVKRQMEQQ